MFTRQFTIKFKPLKSNFVILPENYFKLVSNYKNGCLILSYRSPDGNYKTAYVSWLSTPTFQATGAETEEIGMNSLVAESFGLTEGMSVSCSVIQNTCSIKSCSITLTNEDDYSMVEASAERLQKDLLDQACIVTKSQKLVIWLNKSISVIASVDQVVPYINFGRIQENAGVSENGNNRKSYNGWSGSKIQDYSPKDSRNISTSSSVSSMKKLQTETIQEAAPIESRHLLTSASVSNMINYSAPSSPSAPVNHRKVLEDIKKILTKEEQKVHYFKVNVARDKKQLTKFSQITDVFVSKTLPLNFNQIHIIRTKIGKEYYVRVKPRDEQADETIEINPVLSKILDLDSVGSKVELLEKNLVGNLVEQIELVPLTEVPLQISRDMEEKFKKYIATNCRLLPMILNQNQIFKLDDYLMTIKIYPLSMTVCSVDADILRESIIEVVKKGQTNEYAEMMKETKKNAKDVKDAEKSNCLELEKHNIIIKSTTKYLQQNVIKQIVFGAEQNNLLLAGPAKSGKTSICTQIQKSLELNGVSVNIFNCAQYKGRKVDSIVRDMRIVLNLCLRASPAVFIVLNLDSLAVQSHDEHQSQDSEYHQKLANSIRHLLEEFTHDYGHLVNILVTVSKLSNLNKILYNSFGYYLFKNVVKIPNLEADDRKELMKKLFDQKTLKIEATVDWEKYARVTEGFHVGDIVQFADRAIFYAIKKNFKAPVLTEELLDKSMAISNKLCLNGIRTEVADDESTENADKIPGMDKVIETLEEVLIWPTKFPGIFKKSPLRNQAGVLLFGAPGTGKTFVVSQITKKWNLRLISIKGPELLAKYIGQSEENVRNLFEKAKSSKPCVLFFDEFDSLAPRRGHDSTGVTDRVVNQLLTELDGVKSLEGVSIICATSRPDLIDPALLRSGRIDRLVECQLPSYEERLEIVQWLSKTLTIDSTVDLVALAKKLDHYTGADIKSILTTANMKAIEDELTKSINGNQNKIDQVTITKEHLEHALSGARPSLTTADIQKYQILYEKFINKQSVTADTPKKISLA
ncbi:unnamed protein product [Diamesa serratosioi]